MGAAEQALVARARGIFPAFELHSVRRTTSTQDTVRAAARAGAAPGWCCVAEEQTAGRGRQGRAWVAPPGTALLFSILLRPRQPSAVPFATGIAVVDALAAYGVQARLKWPNDVLAGEGKLAGILIEVEPGAPPAGEPAVVAGVGLNLTVDDFPQEVVGASLHRLLDPERLPGPVELLGAILPELARRVAEADAGGTAALTADWRSRAVGLGGRVRAEVPGRTIEGTAVDIDADGALLVVTATGATVRLVAGDVHLN